MQLYKRPQKPATFDNDVQENIRDVRMSINTNHNPSFPNKWGKYKLMFAEKQYNKCGYCESYVISTHYGDVEHFFPKGAVWKLKDDPSTWGRENPFSSSVKGREKIELSSRGYWWFAYDWNNYLLSCQCCNQQWKKAYFPVKEQNRVLPPNPSINETTLLINPFDGPSPEKHLKFGDLGQVEPYSRSRHGKATITVCGLDRLSLRNSRLQNARRAYRLIQEIQDSTTNDQLDTALKDFYELGQSNFLHSGMVRAIYEQNTSMKWSDLENLMQNIR